MFTACGNNADSGLPLPCEVLAERLKRLSNGWAGNAPCCFLDGFPYRFGFNVKRAELAAECNCDVRFHRGVCVCEAGMEPA